jgi:hypothetical protein
MGDDAFKIDVGLLVGDFVVVFLVGDSFKGDKFYKNAFFGDKAYDCFLGEKEESFVFSVTIIELAVGFATG